MAQVRRQRTSTFLWKRLKTLNSPFPKLSVVDMTNTNLMKMAVDMYPDDSDVNRYADRIDEKRNRLISMGGKQEQEYEQKDYGFLFDDSYRGTTKFGRAYCRGLLPYLPTKILNTFYKETHMELDIRSSTSTMLCRCFPDVEYEIMRRYVIDPDLIYDHFESGLAMGKKAAKKVINCIICSYPNLAQDPDLGNWAELSRDEMVCAMVRDVGRWADALKDRYEEFYNAIVQKCNDEGKMEHVDGVAMSYLAGDMEHSVMRCVMAHLFKDQSVLEDVVWKYDGILFPKTLLGTNTHEQFVADIQSHVLSKMDLIVNFRLGHLHDNSLGICLPNQEINAELDAYGRWKLGFENRFCRMDAPYVFIMFLDAGKRIYDITSKEKFEHVTMEYNKEMVKQWLNDPEKRKYVSRDFIPPPMACRPDYLNLYIGIAAAELQPVEGVDISKYMTHVDVLVGNLNGEHPSYAEYMHNLIAYKMQKPGLKWRVMPIIFSAQGVGKDIWFDFLASIFGEYQCIKDDGIHKFAGTNSHVLEGKLLCCFQEMSYKDIKQHEEALKAIITNKYINIQKKYVNSFTVTNVVDFIGFTNQASVVNISTDDRRYAMFTADSTFMQDSNYIMPLLTFFNEDRNQRAVYQWYMERDISGFDPSRDRPITETHEEVAESSMAHIDQFLKKSLPIWLGGWRGQDRGTVPNTWDFNMLEYNTLRIRACIVVDNWMEYVKEVGIDGHDKKNSMIQFLAKQTRELNARTDKFKTAGHAKIVDKGCQRRGVKCYLIDVTGLRGYLQHAFHEDDDNGQQEEKQNGDGGRALYTVHHQQGGYVVKNRGEVVFETGDLDDANKFMGHPYVEVRARDDGEGYEVLIHPQRRNMEINLGNEYMGEHGKTRLEMKYPWYRYNRCI
jgi:hypothetical protein